MLKKSFILSIVLFSSILLISSCEDDKKTDTEITYTNKIKSMLTSCNTPACHTVDAPAIRQSLASYEDVVAFNNSTRMLSALRHEVDFEPMPRGRDMWTENMIADLEEWIDNGMPQ